MSPEILKKIYFDSCCKELKVLKPGNHSSFSKIIGMSEGKFRHAAKISSEFLTDAKLSLGKAIFLSAKRCKTELNSNYNLGIIILCAPLLRIFMKGSRNLRKDLSRLLKEIPEKDGQLILDSIQFVKPAGIKNYKGEGNIFLKKINLNFLEIMKIGSKWDRISRCYIEDYREILDFGLPLLYSLKKKTSYTKAIEILYLNYLANSEDSHLERKFGVEKARIVMRKSRVLKTKIKVFKKNQKLLMNFDNYLKKFHYNPGTCADLTVTTLLIDKIRDIFKIPL